MMVLLNSPEELVDVWNSSARIWLTLKMDTRMDGSVLAVLAAYQNNLVTSKMMTSQAVQCLLLQMSTKVDFRSESVKQKK